MVYPVSSGFEADVAAGRIKSADLVDLYTKDGAGDPAFLRAWTFPGTCTYKANDPDGVAGAVGNSDVSYESMCGRIIVKKALRMSASLSSEPLQILLDASRSGDDADWVGRFVDRKWHECRMRVRSIRLNVVTEAVDPEPFWEWHGLIDHANLVRKPSVNGEEGEPQYWELKCQGGLFRVRGRRNRTRSHEDQQIRKAGDKFYQGTPLMVSVPLIWNKAPAALPGVVSNGGAAGGARPIGGLIPSLVYGNLT